MFVSYDPWKPESIRRRTMMRIVAALGASVVILIVICRIVLALPASVDFALSIIAALVFTYRFERSPDERGLEGEPRRWTSAGPGPGI